MWHVKNAADRIGQRVHGRHRRVGKRLPGQQRAEQHGLPRRQIAAILAHLDQVR
jgi:hypothetical protein